MGASLPRSRVGEDGNQRHRSGTSRPLELDPPPAPPPPGQLAAMREVTLSLLVLLAAGLPALDANDPEDKDSPFYYDWYRLRVGGLICAAVLCTIGIIVLLSGKCKCKFSQQPSHHPGVALPLITPGSAQNC